MIIVTIKSFHGILVQTIEEATAFNLLKRWYAFLSSSFINSFIIVFINFKQFQRRADSYDEEPAYAQVIRVSNSNSVQSPTSKRSSTINSNNVRTLPKFADIVEENVNGHIDNLFDFVQVIIFVIIVLCYP